MKKKYWHGAPTIHRHMYHIVWLPKYRKKVLEGNVKSRLEGLLRKCAEVNGWEIQELNIQNRPCTLDNTVATEHNGE